MERRRLATDWGVGWVSAELFFMHQRLFGAARACFRHPQDEGESVYHLPTSFNDPSCEAGKEI
jgi:hypothetical protein